MRYAHAENDGVNELLRHCCPFVLQCQSKLPNRYWWFSTRPHFYLAPIGVPGTASSENAFFDGQALKVHTVQGVVKQDHHRAVFWPRFLKYIGKSSRLCRVSSDFSRCCRLFLLACKTMYRSFAQVWFLSETTTTEPLIAVPVN
ncbi:hypothetical protein TNCV_1972391 [Trichonephila clavipes]|nr:hypothetical protein TNCV_1972391 [Trichonephila clavipes]